MIMKNYFRRLTCIFLCVLGVMKVSLALPSDTTDIDQLKQKAVTRLGEIIKLNKHFLRENKHDSLNFIVSIGNENNLPPADSAVYQRQVPGVVPQFVGSAKHAELNDFLKQVFQQQGIACYIVFINYFDYKLNIRLSDDERITGIIAYTRRFEEIKKSGNESPHIQKLKDLHNAISDDVYQSIPKDHPFVFMDIGAYCTPVYPARICSYIGTHYYHNIPVTLKPHLSALILKKFNGAYQGSPDREEVAEINVHALAAAVIQSRSKELILETEDKEELCELLSVENYPFDGSTFVSSAYAALTVEERIHAIQVFLEGYVGGSLLGCNAEQKILAIIKNTPVEQIDSLLSKLEWQQVLSDMIDAIDDFGLGGSNYESLLKILSELVIKSPTLANRLMELHNPAIGAFRSFVWDKSYRLSMFKTPVGTNKYEVNLLDDQQVEIYRSYVSHWQISGYQGKSELPLYEEVWVRDENPTLLHPFDLILFIDHSRLGLIEGGSVGGELGMAIMPAIFMKYADDKKFNANTLKGLVIALDVATLVSGPGAIAKAFQIGSKIRRAFVIADVVNAGISLTINLGDLGDDPRFAEAVKWYNEITLALGIGSIVKNGIAKLPDVANQVQNWIGSVKKQVAKDFITAMVVLRTALKQNPAKNIEDLVRNNKSAESLFALEDQLRKEFTKLYPNELLDLPNLPFPNVSFELQNIVRSRVPERADDLLDVLNENAALKDAMKVEPDLINAWARISSYPSLSTDIQFLKSFSIIDREAKMIKHVFEGDRFPLTGTITSVSGVHHHLALTTKTDNFVAGDIRIRPGTKEPVGTEGLYEGLVEIFDGVNWQPKQFNEGYSTFFPETMSKQDVLEQIAYAHSRGLTWQPPTGTGGSNTFRGATLNGFEVDFYIGQKVNSAPVGIPTAQMRSCFPVQ